MGFLGGLGGGDSGYGFQYGMPQPWITPIRTPDVAGGYPGADDGKSGKTAGGGFSVGSVMDALSALAAMNPPPPPAPPAMDFAPMPRPRFRELLDSAPRINPGQMMPPPAWMQPYLWGGR